MNTLHSSSLEDLIQKALEASNAGQKEIAWKYAEMAAEKDPNAEQAWLILASLSEADQSLHYLENALRANPNSQAARKGVRLIIQQMAAQGKEKEADTKKEEAAIRLQDTAPIPVPKQPEIEEAQTRAASRASIVRTRNPLTAKREAKADSMQESESHVISKEEFRKKLQLSAAVSGTTFSPTSEEPQITPPEPAAESLAGIEEKLSAPAEPLPENEIPAQQSAENAIEEIVGEIKEEPEEQTGSASEGEISATPAATDSIQISEPESMLTGEFEQEPEIPEQKVVENNIGEPIKETFEKQPKAKAAHKAETIKAGKEKRQKKAKLSARKTKKLNKIIGGDVDIIELLLISLAAILLPLLVFLYFYLSG